jgi:serine/threonine protein kinase
LVDAINTEDIRLINVNAPKDFTDIHLDCFVSTDMFGSLALGTFNSALPNVTIKTFLLGSKDFQSTKQDIITATEAAKTMNEFLSKENSSSIYLPYFLCSFCEQSSFHLIFETPIVSTLESWSQYQSSTNAGKLQLIECLPYIGGCLVNALDCLHSAGIIYRSVQPESVHIDASGRIVLVDYAISKIGAVGGKTSTLCGVPDYLAPEQITQQGHNEAVDFWEFGLLLYELFSRQNPFSLESSNELAVLNKITNFGNPTFPELQFVLEFPEDLKSLIRLLVVPDPNKRLGMGSDGFERLKSHHFFHGLQINELHCPPSLRDYATEIKAENLAEGITSELTEKWNDSSVPARFRTATWMEELIRETR